MPGWSGRLRELCAGWLWGSGFGLIVIGLVMAATLPLDAGLRTAICLPLVAVGSVAAPTLYLDYFREGRREVLEAAAGYSTRLIPYMKQELPVIDWKSGVVILEAGEVAPSSAEISRMIKAARQPEPPVPVAENLATPPFADRGWEIATAVLKRLSGEFERVDFAYPRLTDQVHGTAIIGTPRSPAGFELWIFVAIDGSLLDMWSSAPADRVFADMQTIDKSSVDAAVEDVVTRVHAVVDRPLAIKRRGVVRTWQQWS